MGELRNDLEKLGQGFLSLQDLDKSYPQLISSAPLPSSSKTGYGHSQRLIPGYSHCQLQLYLTFADKTEVNSKQRQTSCTCWIVRNMNQEVSVLRTVPPNTEVLFTVYDYARKTDLRGCLHGVRKSLTLGRSFVWFTSRTFKESNKTVAFSSWTPGRRQICYSVSSTGIFRTKVVLHGARIFLSLGTS